MITSSAEIGSHCIPTSRFCRDRVLQVVSGGKTDNTYLDVDIQTELLTDHARDLFHVDRTTATTKR